MSRRQKAKDKTNKAVSGVGTGIGRAKQRVLARVGRNEETIDVQFAYEEEIFSEQYDALQDFEDDAKRFLQCSLDFVETQRKFADLVLELLEASCETYNCALQYQTAAIELEKQQKRLAERIKVEFQEPLTEYIGQYKELADRASKRENLRVDKDRF